MDLYRLDLIDDMDAWGRVTGLLIAAASETGARLIAKTTVDAHDHFEDGDEWLDPAKVSCELVENPHGVLMLATKPE